MKSNIENNKFYSVRETTKLLSLGCSGPTLQKLIHSDIDTNGNQTFKAIVIKRNKQKRYYIKGENIIKLNEKIDRGEMVQK